MAGHDRPLVTSRPVVVTGASGFIAAHVVRDLLARGYTVRGTVRSLASADRVAHLRRLPGADARLELVEADLLSPATLEAAVSGAEHVLHTASPYVLDAADPQRDLVDPAVLGTTSVLEACRGAGVRRVVLTSSMAAITDEPDESHVLTEADWNTRSSLDRNPYYYSKVMAERAAWRFVEEGAPFSLVALNPFLVMGPSLSPGVNVSNHVLVDLLAGVYPAIISLAWGVVDVRDVADAHVRALEQPSASGRYILAGETITMRALVDLLRRLGYGEGWKLPRVGLDCGIGDGVVKLSAYGRAPGVGMYLRTHVGRVPRYDASKARRELGVVFRPIEDTVRDTMADLQQRGDLPPRAA